MRYLIFVLILMGTTACKTNKSGAEISALGESAMSTNTNMPVSPPEVPAEPAIDYNPRAADTYANAVAACQNVARQLCTLDQMNAAYSKGEVYYAFGHLGDYWMLQVFVSGQGNRNNFKASSTTGVTFALVDPTMTREFYCCVAQ
jgi:hypothetical protein